MSQERRLILASGSPRRREILERLGYAFTIRPVDIDESPREGEEATAYVERLAREKAHADARPGEIILAADTVVVIDGELLGKPVDAEDAARMLTRLSGREHEVSTGVAVLDVDGDTLATAIETSVIRFAPLDPPEIAWYVATGEPMDKAGAYAIQGAGSLFVDSINGNYSNVVGLPVPVVYRLLRQTAAIVPQESLGECGT